MSYLMAAGLLVFTSGFLLNRVSRPERAECARCTPDTGCDAAGIFQDTGRAAGLCLERKARVVLLIVDALKYEFAEWYDDDVSMSSYHRNKLPVIHELLQKQPSHSRLYKFVADPPTTTMQRLKGMTTGSLPTFIEVSSNFASGYINEDNLIDQNAADGIVFMGDDTWTNLFPGKFMRQFPSPSFNVWDLDSVDKNVQYRIFFEMKKKDWSLLIAHTLGVDHCGHKHGTQHPEMSRKLKDTNKLITEIVESLEKDMMLFVIGDHGMTETGDHGGDSPSEIEAAMFVYSTNPLLKGFAVNGSNSVNQIDLVPTLSSILGTPIPFSNLGSVILDCLPSQQAETTGGRLLHPLQSLWRNIAQTKQYIEIYSADANLFSKEQLQNLDHVYSLLSERVKHVDSPQELEAFVRDTKSYFKMLKDTCSEVWVQFDSGLISKGLLLMFCSLFFFYLFITGIPESRMCDIFKSSFLQCAVTANLITIAITTCLFLLNVLEELWNMTFFATGAVSIGFLVLVIAQNWDVISMCWYEHRRIRLLTYVSRIILLLTVCGLFSNSYIVEEDKVLSFLFITLLCLLVFDLRKSDSDVVVERKTSRFAGSRSSRIPNFRTIVLIVGLVACASVRLSHYFWRCREEHLQRACSVSATGKVDWSTVSNNWERVLPAVVILALYVTVVKLWLRDRGNLTGFAPSVMVGQYCSVLIGVCISCYWVLQKLPKFYKVKFVLSWQVKTLPNVVYFLCVLAILVLYYRPLSIYMLPKKRESIEVYREENLVPRLFEKIKDSISRKRVDTDDTPVICGIGTTYSAAFISLSVFLTLLYSLLLGDSLSPSTFLMFVTCTAVLGLSAIERYKNANTICKYAMPNVRLFMCLSV